LKMFGMRVLLLIVGLSVAYGLPEPEAGLLPHQLNTLLRVKRAGACETTADCIKGNVCSKWGWCQWTNIYGEDGPSQGSSAPAGGVAGQCTTSADCGSRVPYCSELGFCHGGRLPFDEAQLEIADEDKEGDEQPQGFINNNPRKNNPALKSGQKGANSAKRTSRKQNSAASRTSRKSSTSRKQISAPSRTSRNSNTDKRRKGPNRNNFKQSKGKTCPGGSVDSCIESCIPIKQVRAYGVCVEECGRRC